MFKVVDASGHVAFGQLWDNLNDIDSYLNSLKLGFVMGFPSLCYNIDYIEKYGIIIITQLINSKLHENFYEIIIYDV